MSTRISDWKATDRNLSDDQLILVTIPSLYEFWEVLKLFLAHNKNIKAFGVILH